MEEKREKSCMCGHTERMQLCPHCSSSCFLASKCVLTMKNQGVVAGCGHVQYAQGACSSQELRMGILGTHCKLLIAVGLA